MSLNLIFRLLTDFAGYLLIHLTSSLLSGFGSYLLIHFIDFFLGYRFRFISLIYNSNCIFVIFVDLGFNIYLSLLTSWLFNLFNLLDKLYILRLYFVLLIVMIRFRWAFMPVFRVLFFGLLSRILFWKLNQLYLMLISNYSLLFDVIIYWWFWTIVV